MRKHVCVVVGLFVGMGFWGTVLAACNTILYFRECPTLTPTVGTCAGGCPTYYTYVSSPTYTAGTTAGPCKNPHATSFSVTYTVTTASSAGTCATVGCGYVTGAPLSRVCDTTTCDDYGC